MNGLRAWRRLRSVPESGSHKVDRDSLPAVIPGHDGRVAALLAAIEEPEPTPVPVADPDDPTPIFDAVMGDKWWPIRRDDGSVSDGVMHALAYQFAVAFVLDEFTDDERAEIRREVIEDCQFGWAS